MPDELGSLTNMQVLRLSNNRLGALPTTFAQMLSLRGLNVAANQFTAIPVLSFNNLRYKNLECNLSACGFEGGDCVRSWRVNTAHSISEQSGGVIPYY